MEHLSFDTSVNVAYAFTYKFLGNKPNDVKTYLPVITNLNNNGYVKFCKSEKDSKDRIHIHGIVLLRKGFFRKKLIVQGFHGHFSEITNEAVWLKYCSKDVKYDNIDVPFLFDPIYEINN